MPAKFKITDEVRDVLRRSLITDTTVTLPEQLDRTTYVAVDKVLKGAGGKWNRSQGKHIFPRDPRPLLSEAVEKGEATNRQQALQAFYTPSDVAARVVELAQVDDTHTILEPSCGDGALLKEVFVKAPRALVQGFDIDPEAAKAARELICSRGAATVQDFLTIEPKREVQYDRVVMNPPFTRGQGIKHVLHAAKMLAPGGYLVAILPPSVFTSTTKLAKEFQALFEEYDGYSEKLPENSFKSSGTSVATVVVKLRKPL